MSRDNVALRRPIVTTEKGLDEWANISKIPIIHENCCSPE